MDKQILRKIKKILNGNDFSIDPSLVTYDKFIREFSGWDSLKHLTFFIQIEMHFHVDISPKDFPRILTIKDLIKFIKTCGN
tara:strand:- start:2096 stop:2338 length:243 start_codon:yes stop_codon:yes gene_type:complete